MSHPSSPCVNVCAIDPGRGVCTGCCRTLEEIAAWGGLSEPERQRIMAGLPTRRRTLEMEEPMTETRLVYLLPESAEPGPDGNPVMRWGRGVDPFGAAMPLQENPAQGTVQIVGRAFSREECARIARLGETGESVVAATEKVTGYRSSHITWIQPGAQTKWLYHRMGLLLLNANGRYRFDLAGLAEPLQYADYGEGGHFEWHTDLGVQGTSGRKLSVTVQISEPDAYEGGDLEFINVKRGAVPREPGTAIIFPSYLAHRVTPVTRGRRHSLVAWAYGPSLR